MVLSNESRGMFSFKGSLSCAKRNDQTFGLSNAWWEHFSRMHGGGLVCGGCGVT